ncbi:MAG: Ig-like domain-containing protein, partial [Pirellulales bacterium]
VSPSGQYQAEANEANQTVHFVVTGDTNTALFAVPPTITVNNDGSGTAALNYTLAPLTSGSAQITVELVDNAGAANGGQDTSPTQTFTITANFVNDPPYFTHQGPNQEVNEDSALTTVPGWAVASPGNGNADKGETISYLVTSDSKPSLFAANGQPAVDSTGTLTFTPGLHTFGTATVTIVAVDNGGTANGGVNTSQPVTLTIKVDQINHPPTVANALPPVTVNEQTQAFDQVLTNLSHVFDDIDVDLGLGDKLTLSIAGDDNPSLVTGSLSSMDPASAALTLDFAALQFGVAHIDLRATDQAGATADDVLTVTVNAVNQPPSFTIGPNQQVIENAGPQMVSPWATGISPGPPNESSQTVKFAVTSDTNPSLFSVPPAIDSSGKLTYTAAP